MRQPIHLRHVLAALYALFPTLLAGAQSPAKDLAQLLQQRVGHEQVILQNFSAAPTVQASVSASGITFTPSLERSFSIISFPKVILNGQSVILNGTKQYVLRSKGQLARSAETEPVRLEITVDPGVTPSELSLAAGEIFFSDVKAALEAVPASARDLVPAHVESPVPQTQVPPCDCAAGPVVCPLQGDKQGWKHPTLIHQQNLEFPPGSPQGTNVTTESALQINDKGEVAAVWLLRAPSLSFAQATFASLRRYVFTPATCHGSPVEMYVQVDQRFSRY